MTEAATGEASGYVATVIESVILLAQRDAVVVGDFLVRLRAATKSSERQQPVRTFLEVGLGLAAIAQIWLWERAGLRPHLHVVDLPPAEEAWKELAEPETDDLAPYSRSNAGSRLLKQVVGAFLTHCALAAPDELGVDIVMDGSFDESLLEEFVDFVWRHRHLMTLED